MGYLLRDQPEQWRRHSQIPSRSFIFFIFDIEREDNDEQPLKAGGNVSVRTPLYNFDIAAIGKKGNGVKATSPETDTPTNLLPAHHEAKAESNATIQRVATKYPDRLDHHLQKNNRRDIDKNRNQRAPSPESWCKPVDLTGPVHGPPVWFEKAASAVVLAQAFSKPASDWTQQSQGGSRARAQCALFLADGSKTKISYQWRKDSRSYVNMKRKACAEVAINSIDFDLPEDVSESELISKVHELNMNPNVHGTLVQLPLPKHINEEKILSEISLEKDVDGFHPLNLGELAMKGGDPLFVPVHQRAFLAGKLKALVALLKT